MVLSNHIKFQLSKCELRSKDALYWDHVNVWVMYQLQSQVNLLYGILEGIYECPHVVLQHRRAQNYLLE